MSEPIAEQIITNLKSRLETINIVAAYQITAKVEDAHERGNATDENKIIIEMFDLMRDPEKANANRDYYLMTVNLYCLAPASKTFTTPPRTRMLRLHSAIWRCLREDTEHTLGGLARDCTPQKGDFGEYKTTPALLLPVLIEFDTIQDDPFQR